MAGFRHSQNAIKRCCVGFNTPVIFSAISILYRAALLGLEFPFRISMEIRFFALKKLEPLYQSSEIG
jgi:hypothetical protein